MWSTEGTDSELLCAPRERATPSCKVSCSLPPICCRNKKNPHLASACLDWASLEYFGALKVSSLIDGLAEKETKEPEASQQVAWTLSTWIMTPAFPLMPFPSSRWRVFTSQERNSCCKLAKGHPKEHKDHTDSGAGVSKLQAVRNPKQNAATALECPLESELISQELAKIDTT